MTLTGAGSALMHTHSLALLCNGLRMRHMLSVATLHAMRAGWGRGSTPLHPPRSSSTDRALEPAVTQRVRRQNSEREA
mgnify:CR=1 FL=1